MSALGSGEGTCLGMQTLRKRGNSLPGIDFSGLRLNPLVAGLDFRDETGTGWPHYSEDAPEIGYEGRLREARGRGRAGGSAPTGHAAFLSTALTVSAGWPTICAISGTL
jgi:hypothetical protein